MGSKIGSKAPGQTRGNTTEIWNCPGHLKPRRAVLGEVFPGHIIFYKEAQAKSLSSVFQKLKDGYSEMVQEIKVLATKLTT